MAFSFGGAAASAHAAAAGSVPGAAATGGGFSFGGTKPAASGTASGFGGGSGGTKAAASAGGRFGTKATSSGAATAVGTGFAFGAAPAAGAAASGTAAAGTGFGGGGFEAAMAGATSSLATIPAVPSHAPLVSSVDNKSLGTIYDAWERADLEIKQKFREHCDRMQALDRNGLEYQRRIKLALSEVNGLEHRQQQLDNFIRQSLQTQRQLEDDLQRYEARLDEELQQYNVQPQALHQDATSRRLRMYEDASQLNENLNQLTHTIGGMVKRMNQSAQDVGAADSMVKKVEAILNEHYKTLQWIDAETSQLEGAVHELRELGIATQ